MHFSQVLLLWLLMVVTFFCIDLAFTSLFKIIPTFAFRPSKELLFPSLWLLWFVTFVFIYLAIALFLRLLSPMILLLTIDPYDDVGMLMLLFVFKCDFNTSTSRYFYFITLRALNNILFRFFSFYANLAFLAKFS